MGNNITRVRPFSFGLNGYLNGMINHKRMQQYKFNGKRGLGVTKFAEIRLPTDTLLFGAGLEGQPMAGSLWQYPEPDRRWIGFPVDWHNRGMNFAFTDGHVEHWKWCYKKRGKGPPAGSGAPLQVANECDLEDLRRVQRGLIPN